MAEINDFTIDASYHYLPGFISYGVIGAGASIDLC
jgi:hypothetical protein